MEKWGKDNPGGKDIINISSKREHVAYLRYTWKSIVKNETQKIMVSKG